MGKKIEIISDGIIEIEGVKWYDATEYITLVGNDPGSTRTARDHHRTGKNVKMMVLGKSFFRPSTKEEFRKFKMDKSFTPLTES